MPDFEPIQRALASGQTPSADALEQLSSLEAEDRLSFDAFWQGLEPQSRRTLVQELDRVAQTNVMMDFSKIGALVLGDSDPSVRAYGVRLVGLETDPEALEPCIQIAMSDSDTGVRLVALDTLGAFALAAQADGWPDALQRRIEAVLLEQIQAPGASSTQREAALLSVAYLTTPVVEAEIRRAYSEPVLQGAAIEAMGRNCQEIWIPNLLREVASPDPELRMRALEACAEMEDEQLVPAVVGRLDDSDLEVRLAAVQALAALGGTDARVALERVQASPDPELRSAATEALVEIQFKEDPLSFEA